MMGTRSQRAAVVVLAQIGISGIVSVHQVWEILSQRYARITHRECRRILMTQEEFEKVSPGLYKRVQ